MTRCEACGNENPTGFRFCGHCGASLAEPGPRGEVRKTVTIVFCDVAGSTELGEGRDPEAIRSVMNRYFSEARRIIEGHGGFVEKFVGDAVMAAFGIPVAHEDDALRAVRAAAEIRDALATLNAEFEREWGLRINIRSGVNTGEVIAADGATRETFATGDTVNTAARLEQTAQLGEVLLGESTYRLVASRVAVEQVEPLSLKGKAEPVPAYRLIDVLEERSAARQPPSGFVGREEELRLLREAATRSGQGVCELVTILGEPGVGKSRLLEEFMAGADVALVGRCRSYGEGAALRPVVEIIRRATSVPDEASIDLTWSRIDDLVSGLPNESMVADRLAGLLGVSALKGPVDELFWAVRSVLEKLAASGPVVVAVEDLHWAEDIVFRLLLHLTEHVSGPMLLLCTARTELMTDRPEWPGALVNATTLALEPLTDDESKRFVSLAVGGRELPRPVCTHLVDAAGGNPLFLEETLSMLIEEGTLRRDGESWRVAGEVSAVQVPQSLTALLQSRVDRLDAGEQDALCRASLIGQRFETEALRALLADDLGPEDVVGSLAAKGFVEPESRRDAFSIRHALVREAAYRRMPKKLRAELHERFASWLEDRGRAGEIVAFHLERSILNRRELGIVDRHALELARRAIELLCSTCDQAIARGDTVAARSLMLRSAALLPKEETGLDDILLAARIGKLAVTLGEWTAAVESLSISEASGHPPALRDLGVAICKLHRSDPSSSEYRRGQELLERAAAPENGDPDAVASLAGTWRGVDEDRARELYARAQEMDAGDPYALGNHLEYQIAARRGLAPVERLHDAIDAALDRCRSQADAGANLPWAFYDMGKFRLLLGEPHESVAAYCKALQLTTADYMIEGALGSLSRIQSVRSELPGFQWIEALLRVARMAKFSDSASSEDDPVIRGSVVILTGGSGAWVEDEVRSYGALLGDAFAGLEGTIVSGGTTQGVSRLAGDLASRSSARRRAVGYAPAAMPQGVFIDDDPSRYAEIRRTDGSDFSPLEPLLAWSDLLRSGWRPEDVALLGINGGPIAAAEYRIALALGARVGIVSGSGRAANALLEDRDWVPSPTLSAIPARSEELRSFLTA